MPWNGIEKGTESKGNFGVEYGRCSEWNEMENLKNGKEHRLSYFHTFMLTTYEHIQTCNKLQSNAIDTAYQYEHVSVVISQCIHIC